MLWNNPGLYSTFLFHDNSIVIETDPITGQLNISFSDESEDDLREQCALAGGYFDVNLGEPTCDLRTDFSTNITVTLTDYVSCLANTSECRLKNYECVQVSMENEGFFNCRTSDSRASDDSSTLLGHNADDTNGPSNQSNEGNRRGLFFGDISHGSIFPQTPHDMINQDLMPGMNDKMFGSAFPGGPLIGKAPDEDVASNKTEDYTIEHPDSNSNLATNSNLRHTPIRSGGSGMTAGFAVLGATMVTVVLLA